MVVPRLSRLLPWLEGWFASHSYKLDFVLRINGTLPLLQQQLKPTLSPEMRLPHLLISSVHLLASRSMLASRWRSGGRPKEASKKEAQKMMCGE